MGIIPKQQWLFGESLKVAFMDVWKRRIENKDMVVGVLGLGYVGLPLARVFASAGLKVIGFDA